MKPLSTLAAGAAVVAILWTTCPGTGSLAGAVAAEPPQVAPSQDLPNAPSAPLAPTVHQQALATAPVPKVELWQGATLGMSLDQVKALFPKGVDPVFPPAEDDGSQPLLEMGGQVYGRDALVFMYFKGGALTSVLVSVGGVKPNGTLGNMEDARALETAFSGYYGKPKLCFDSTARGLDHVDCRWEGHGLRIGLSYQDYGGASPHMAIAIRPLPPPPRAKSPFFGKRARKGSSAS